MTAERWEALSWDLQETYMFGMSEDPNVPFTFTEDAGRIPAAMSEDGPRVRENVDGGSNVFDIRGMIADLEADPNARRRT
jgi:hypothetical protein